MTDENNNRIRTRKAPVVLALLLLCALLLGVGAGAWLSYQRRVTALARIDNPTNIFIGAGRKEALSYLDLTDLDLTNSACQQDFVFTVSGEGLDNIQLQLAYTTNNRLSFEIYEGNPTPVTAETSGYTAKYVSADGTTYYYAPQNTTDLIATYLNRTETGVTDGMGLGDPAKNTNVSDEETHVTYPAELLAETSKVNKYAYPIYCQTNAISVTMDEHNQFCKYFILRVFWPTAVDDTGETDILYIAAKQA